MHLRLSISYNLSFFLFVHIKKKKKKNNSRVYRRRYILYRPNIVYHFCMCCKIIRNLRTAGPSALGGAPSFFSSISFCAASRAGRRCPQTSS